MLSEETETRAYRINDYQSDGENVGMQEKPRRARRRNAVKSKHTTADMVWKSNNRVIKKKVFCSCFSVEMSEKYYPLYLNNRLLKKKREKIR